MTLLVLGHRGHRHHRIPYRYPQACFENSLQAFEFAFKHSDGLECDVIRSSMHTAYMSHDMDTLPNGTTIYEMQKNLDAKSAKLLGERMIYQLADAEIAKLKLCDGQEIPSLEKLLRMIKHYPDRTLVIELKGPDTNDAALTQIEAALSRHDIASEQIIFSSFNLPALTQLRSRIGNRFKIGALFDTADLSLAQMYPDWPDAPQDAFYVPFRPDAGVLELPCMAAMQPDYLHIECLSLTTESIAAIDRIFPAAKIILWTRGEPHPDDDPVVLDIVRKFYPTGKLHAVISDFPEAVKAGLRSL